MAFVLYREGDTDVVNGVKCESARFLTVMSMKSALKGEWVADPKDLAPTFEEADTNDTGKLSVEEVRAAAKTAGIEGHDKKRIKTLKAELGYDSDDED